MSGGWSDLVRIPFFGFLPNFFLGVGFLYILKWTGVIGCWNQLFEPIYNMGPEWAIPSWLVAFFILVVVFGLGWGVSSVGDFFTMLPFRIDMTAEDYLKHTYFYDYSNTRPAYAGYPTTIRYTPFRKSAIHHGILWHIFKGEHTVSEVTEKSFAITGALNSGLFVLALTYAVLEMVRIKEFFALVLIVAMVFVVSVITYRWMREECKQLKLELISKTPTIELTSRSRELLFYLLVCPISGWLVAFAGLGWLVAYANKLSMWKPAFRVLFALALALRFYREAVRDRIHANALDYTHYWKIKEEETKKEQEDKNQKS